jgi:hypothetical protein
MYYAARSCQRPRGPDPGELLAKAILLTKGPPGAYGIPAFRVGVAQLEECKLWELEVVGSRPTTRTNMASPLQAVE